MLAAATLLVVMTATVSAEPIVGPKPQTVADVFLPTPPDIRVEAWVTGLEAPWSLVFLPDGRALVSERPGRIRLIKNGHLEKSPYAVFETTRGASGAGDFFLNLFARGEGGLMGLAVHPKFPTEPYIYAMPYLAAASVASATASSGVSTEAPTASSTRLSLAAFPAPCFTMVAASLSARMECSTQRRVKSSKCTWRRTLRHLAERCCASIRAAAFHRTTPFPNSPVWSYGHRNPQGLAWHPETGALYQSEHGPSGEVGFGAHDEINIIEEGRNYGWPRIVGAPGRAPYVDPIAMWPNTSVPPAGMTFHKGALYVATLRSEALIRLRIEGRRVLSIERLFAEDEYDGVLGRLRDAVDGPDGHLYVLTSNRDGRGSPRPGDDKILRMTVAR